MDTSEKLKTLGNACTDCGAVVAEGKAGCLKLFEEILSGRFSDYRDEKIHRLTVDAYSLQHPETYMHSGKSFAAHLTGIYAALNAEDTLAVNQMVQRWLSTNPKIDKPAPLPQHKGNLTVTFIHGAADSDEHINRVLEWAQEVWNAWFKYHALAKQLIEEATKGSNK